jgi:hypothetical protein
MMFRRLTRAYRMLDFARTGVRGPQTVASAF